MFQAASRGDNMILRITGGEHTQVERKEREGREIENNSDSNTERGGEKDNLWSLLPVNKMLV